MKKLHRWTRLSSVSSIEGSLADAKRRLAAWNPAPGAYNYQGREEIQARIERLEAGLAYAKWEKEYVATHDVFPAASDKREDGWGNRNALVVVEGVKYRASVVAGETVRIAFARRGENTGHHWYLTVNQVEPWLRVTDHERCEKSQSLATAALQAHLHLRWKDHLKSLKPQV